MATRPACWSRHHDVALQGSGQRGRDITVSRRWQAAPRRCCTRVQAIDRERDMLVIQRPVCTASLFDGEISACDKQRTCAGSQLGL